MGIDRTLDQLVRQRAGDRCEYCRAPQSSKKLRFPVDHVIAKQHHGLTAAQNLALCCPPCNLAKGPNIAGLDPAAGLTRLFNPRTDSWDAHFRLDGAVIVGLTPVGRVTVDVLAMNQRYQVLLREQLIKLGAL